VNGPSSKIIDSEGVMFNLRDLFSISKNLHILYRDNSVWHTHAWTVHERYIWLSALLVSQTLAAAPQNT